MFTSLAQAIVDSATPDLAASIRLLAGVGNNAMYEGLGLMAPIIAVMLLFGLTTVFFVLLFCMAAAVVLYVLSPFAFAGLVMAPTRVWFTKWATTMFAVLFAKVPIAILLALSVSLFANSANAGLAQSFANAGAGLILGLGRAAVPAARVRSVLVHGIGRRPARRAHRQPHPRPRIGVLRHPDGPRRRQRRPLRGRQDQGHVHRSQPARHQRHLGKRVVHCAGPARAVRSRPRSRRTRHAPTRSRPHGNHTRRWHHHVDRSAESGCRCRPSRPGHVVSPREYGGHGCRRRHRQLCSHHGRGGSGNCRGRGRCRRRRQRRQERQYDREDHGHRNRRQPHWIERRCSADRTS